MRCEKCECDDQNRKITASHFPISHTHVKKNLLILTNNHEIIVVDERSSHLLNFFVSLGAMQSENEVFEAVQCDQRK